MPTAELPAQPDITAQAFYSHPAAGTAAILLVELRPISRAAVLLAGA